MDQPETYSKFSDAQKRSAQSTVDGHLNKLKWDPKGCEEVLDIGCGSGDVTLNVLKPKLPSTISKLIGLDVSEEMLKYARSQNDDPKVEFFKMDISANNIPDEFIGRFDLIFSSFCLHWIQDQRTAFKNIYKLLKPGGQILVSIVGHSTFLSPYETLSVSPKWNKYLQGAKRYLSPYHSCEDPEKVISATLSSIGFTTRFCKGETEKFTFPDLDNFRHSVDAVIPKDLKIPTTIRKDFIEDYINEQRKLKCTERNSKNEETVFVKHNIIVIVASKE